MRNKRQSFFRCIIAILSPSVQTGSDLAMRPTTGGFSFLLGVPVRQTGMLSTSVMELSSIQCIESILTRRAIGTFERK